MDVSWLLQRLFVWYGWGGFVETCFVWVVVAGEVAFLVSGGGDDPVAAGCVFGAVFPAVEEFFEVFGEAAGFVGGHVFVGVPVVAHEFFQGFHSDAVAFEASVAFNVNGAHIPIACANHPVGPVIGFAA